MARKRSRDVIVTLPKCYFSNKPGRDSWNWTKTTIQVQKAFLGTYTIILNYLKVIWKVFEIFWLSLTLTNGLFSLFILYNKVRRFRVKKCSFYDNREDLETELKSCETLPNIAIQKCFNKKSVLIPSLIISFFFYYF